MADDQIGPRKKTVMRRPVSFLQGFDYCPPRSDSGTPLLASRVFGAGAARLWLRETRTHPVLMTGLLTLWGLAVAVVVMQAVR